MRGRLVALVVVSALGAAARPGRGQFCDDGNGCTIDDMCVANRRCVGSPVSGGPCSDLIQECLTNRSCENGRCGGTPVEDGTPCHLSCGACMGGVCMPDQSRAGQPCEDTFGPCTTGDRCQFGSCVGDRVRCPDLDNNRCTEEVCDPRVGECISLVPAPGRECGGCGHCNPATGICDSSNDGMSCDDQDPCTSNSICTGGACPLGTPNTPGPPLATPTFTPPPTPIVGPCVGDCDGDGAVAISDLIRGVNIALGSASLDTCHSFDADGDGMVAINELIQAVNGALGACG